MSETFPSLMSSKSVWAPPDVLLGYGNHEAQVRPLNPILSPSADDRNIVSEALTPEERHQIATAININNSDIDYCEFEGRTMIYYTWCDQGQHGGETTFLAHAFYDGPLQEWMESYFPA